jgi:hypothetical protein
MTARTFVTHAAALLLGLLLAGGVGLWMVRNPYGGRGHQAPG